MWVRQSVLIITAVMLAAPGAGAAEMWSVSHVAAGAGAGQVFDGGAAQTGNDSAIGERMEFSVTDVSREGPLGAAYTSMGSSEVVTDDRHLSLNMHFLTAYEPSQLPGGDRPGGEGEGEVMAEMRFVMPVDEMIWTYSLDIETVGDFGGRSRVVVMNLTESTVMLAVYSTSVSAEETLVAHTGDLIRVWGLAFGSNSDSAGSTDGGFFRSALSMTFTVPEPGTLWFFGIGVVLMVRRGLSNGKEARR